MATPVITNSFACRQIRPGDTWKIYLLAEDPEGDMKAMVCTVDQPGAGTAAAGRTKIREDQRRVLSGYLFLSTGGAGLAFSTLTLTVQIEDQAGNQSNPVTFPLSLNPRAAEGEPPPGVFQERELGPVMVTVLSPASGA